MFKRFCAFVIVMAALSPAFAEEASRLDKILQSGVLRVGTTGDYKPFTARDAATQQFSGFDIDQAESLGKALGVRVEYVPTSWPALMKVATTLLPSNSVSMPLRTS